jgi:hypothetical protein
MVVTVPTSGMQLSVSVLQMAQGERLPRSGQEVSADQLMRSPGR